MFNNTEENIRIKQFKVTSFHFTITIFITWPNIFFTSSLILFIALMIFLGSFKKKSATSIAVLITSTMYQKRYMRGMHVILANMLQQYEKSSATLVIL